MLEWSNNEDLEDETTPHGDKSHEKILAGLSREEPYSSSRPISPSQINMQVQLPSRGDPTTIHHSSQDERGETDQEPSPIKPNPDSS